MNDSDGMVIVKAALMLVACAALIFGVTYGCAEIDLAWESHFAPRQEQVRREVFEQTKSYRQGIEQELQQEQLDYARGTAEQKAAIASVVLHQTAGVNVSSLSPASQSFINQIKNSQGIQ